MTTYGIVLFDGAEELDFAGPWEVFTVSEMLRNDGSLPPGQVATIAQTNSSVRCNKGMRVEVDHSFADAPKRDVLLVPGGNGYTQGSGKPRATGVPRGSGR